MTVLPFCLISSIDSSTCTETNETDVFLSVTYETRRRPLLALHLKFLLLFLLLQSGAAEALGNSGDDAGGVWEVRGGTRTRLVPDPAWTSYLIAGADRSGRTRMKRQEAALRTWPMLLSRCCSPTDTLIASAATT